jgi:hypothetical protein
VGKRRSRIHHILPSYHGVPVERTWKSLVLWSKNSPAGTHSSSNRENCETTAALLRSDSCTHPHRQTSRIKLGFAMEMEVEMEKETHCTGPLHDSSKCGVIGSKELINYVTIEQKQTRKWILENQHGFFEVGKLNDHVIVWGWGWVGLIVGMIVDGHTIMNSSTFQGCSFICGQTPR